MAIRCEGRFVGHAIVKPDTGTAGQARDGIIAGHALEGARH
ncbi:MAG: hypothetical protein Q6373_024300 [Candidatus Sigynarchaeota archaeon]